MAFKGLQQALSRQTLLHRPDGRAEIAANNCMRLTVELKNEIILPGIITTRYCSLKELNHIPFKSLLRGIKTKKGVNMEAKVEINGKEIDYIDTGFMCYSSLPCQHDVTVYSKDGTVIIKQRLSALDIVKFKPIMDHDQRIHFAELAKDHYQQFGHDLSHMAYPPEGEEIPKALSARKADMARRKRAEPFYRLLEQEKQSYLAAADEVDPLLSEFLFYASRGQKNKVKEILTALTDPQELQRLLLAQAKFTDFSGRQFQCSAYEYVYWAGMKDMHLLMLPFMSEATKSSMQPRCELIKERGLDFVYKNTSYCTPHHDLNPLILALESYIRHFKLRHQPELRGENFKENLAVLFFAVGAAQLEVTADVAQIYCSLSFENQPLRTENIPDDIIVFLDEYIEPKPVIWFPQSIPSEYPSLGIKRVVLDYGVFSEPTGNGGVGGIPRGLHLATCDLEALRLLVIMKENDRASMLVTLQVPSRTHSPSFFQGREQNAETTSQANLSQTSSAPTI